MIQTDRPPKVRWGILGYARIASENLMPAMQRSANSEIHALASRDAAKREDGSKRFGVAKTFGSYTELLQDPEVEAVYIPLPNSLHREWTIRAAEAGKHVLCEKPLALNAAEARDMVAAGAANGVRIMEAFMYRYTDRMRWVRDVLGSGVLGEIKAIHSTFRFRLTNPASIKLKPELGGGALYDVGCYPVNFIGMVTEEIAQRAAGTAAAPASVAVECVREGGVDVALSAVMQYASGLLATLDCGFNSQRRVHAEIIGSTGTLEIPDTFLDNPGELMLITDAERRAIRVEQSDRYRLEVEDFAAAIRQQLAPRLGLAETLRNMEVIDRLYAAARG